jgi:deoxyribonuclease V
VGLLADTPAVGCAKSVLKGKPSGELDHERGAWLPLVDVDETIGAAVRTRRGVRPVYVSIGHKVRLEDAIGLALACGGGYRVPEPTRLAHLAAAGKLPESP